MDAYLKLEEPNIEGESLDKGHEKWIELTGWSWNLTMPMTEGKSTGGARTAGQVKCDPFTLSKNMDKTSPKLFEYMCSGKHFKKATIEIMRSVGEGDRGQKQTFCKYEMEHVVISTMGPDGGSDAPTERLTLDPGTVKFTYTHADQKTGKSLGKVEAAWDFLANKKV